MVAVQMGEGSRRAELLPAVLILGMVLWIFTTTGGDEIFVSEVLSRAYDSQAEHFLHGDVGVDLNAIVHEVPIVDGNTRMYFGPFPAFLRFSLNYIVPERPRCIWRAYRGFAQEWSR